MGNIYSSTTDASGSVVKTKQAKDSIRRDFPNDGTVGMAGGSIVENVLYNVESLEGTRVLHFVGRDPPVQALFRSDIVEALFDRQVVLATLFIDIVQNDTANPVQIEFEGFGDRKLQSVQVAGLQSGPVARRTVYQFLNHNASYVARMISCMNEVLYPTINLVSATEEQLHCRNFAVQHLIQNKKLINPQPVKAGNMVYFNIERGLIEGARKYLKDNYYSKMLYINPSKVFVYVDPAVEGQAVDLFVVLRVGIVVYNRGITPYLRQSDLSEDSGYQVKNPTKDMHPSIPMMVPEPEPAFVLNPEPPQSQTPASAAVTIPFVEPEPKVEPKVEPKAEPPLPAVAPVPDLPQQPSIVIDDEDPK